MTTNHGDEEEADAGGMGRASAVDHGAVQQAYGQVDSRGFEQKRICGDVSGFYNHMASANFSRKKMLWDRFRVWRVPRKYNSNQVAASRPISTLVASPKNAMATSKERYAFHDAMTSMGGWLRSIVDSGSWRASAQERRIHMQRLVSRVHMAIESEAYDSHARLRELQGIESQAQSLVVPMAGGTMHPRVLTALMRVWIADWPVTPWKRQMMNVVRAMVCRAAQQGVCFQHPLAAVSRLVSSQHQPEEIVLTFFKSFQENLIDQIIDEDPDFAVREQVYAARVLASIGRPAGSVALLSKTRLRSDVTEHTQADFHSALGYSQMKAGRYEDAIEGLQAAVDVFNCIGESSSEGAEYAHFCLSTCYDQLNNLHQLEHHLEAALRAWEANAILQNSQGGIKIIRDLHRVYERQNKTTERVGLEGRYSEYFEEVPEAAS